MCGGGAGGRPRGPYPRREHDGMAIVAVRWRHMRQRRAASAQSLQEEEEIDLAHNPLAQIKFNGNLVQQPLAKYLGRLNNFENSEKIQVSSHNI